MTDIEGGDEEPKDTLPSLRRAGEHDATFAEFYRAQEHRLVKMLMSQGASHPDAQDAVVEAMRQVARRWTTIDNPRPWAARAAMNAFRAMRKADTRRTQAENSYAQQELCDGGMDSLEQWQMAIDLLKRLPEKQRNVFALREMDGYSTKETAEILGMSTGAVRSSLCQAHKSLSAEMRRGDGGVPRQRGQTHTTARGGKR